MDQVIQVGAPKGVSRLVQRVGRANHRMDEASNALLVPANRFELLECEAAIEGVAAGDQDGAEPPAPRRPRRSRPAPSPDCRRRVPTTPTPCIAEIRQAAPYAALAARTTSTTPSASWKTAATPWPAYDRYRKLFRDSEGRVHIRGARVARQARMNLGTIVEAPLLKVRYAGRGGTLGEVEESFVTMMSPGDTFMFAGRLLQLRAPARDHGRGRRRRLRRAHGPGLRRRPPAAHHQPGRAASAPCCMTPATWTHYPEPVREWLALQLERSELPGEDDLLVEIFPRNGRWYLVAYCFEGRNAHQTLGMLLTRRMERFGYGPLGFVATDYVIAVWSAEEPTDAAGLFEQDMMGDDLEAWMAESSMLRRTFRNVAVISGLVDRNQPGQERSRRQVTVNTDLIYDVLRRHQPDHVLLRATRADACRRAD